jgi:hypothetical protein
MVEMIGCENQENPESCPTKFVGNAGKRSTQTELQSFVIGHATCQQADATGRKERTVHEILSNF